MPLQARRRDLARRDAGAAEDAVHDQLAVDHQRDRLADALVLERVDVERLPVQVGDARRGILAHRKTEIDHPARRRGDDLEFGVALKPGHVGRRHCVDQLHRAREQRRNPRRIVRDEADLDVPELRLLPPEPVIGGKIERLAWLPADQLVWPSPDCDVGRGKILARLPLSRGL